MVRPCPSFPRFSTIPLIDGRQSERAMLVRRGVQRLLIQMGAHVLPELRWPPAAAPTSWR